MTEISTESLEFAEAEAYADMFAVAPTSLGLEVHRVAGSVVLLAQPLPIMLFNRAIGLGVREPGSAVGLEPVLSLYRARNIKSFAVQASPSLQSSILEIQGLEWRDNWAKVFRKPDPNVQITTDLRVELIGSDRAADFAQVVMGAFGMPAFLEPWLTAMVGRKHWWHYLAFDHDLPVACAAMFTRDGLSWLGLGGTLASHRRRGAQGALMARRIRDAAALGSHWVITETGEDTPTHPNPSFRNMMRAGFTLAYQQTNWQGSPALKNPDRL